MTGALHATPAARVSMANVVLILMDNESSLGFVTKLAFLILSSKQYVRVCAFNYLLCALFLTLSVHDGFQVSSE